MEKSKLKILLVEDDSSDVEFVRWELEKLGISTIDQVLDMQEFKRHFIPGKYDVILCDYNLGKDSGIEILQDVRAIDVSIPFIFVSGAIVEERTVELLKRGATDYVLKNNLDKLSFVLSRAMNEVEARLKEKIGFESLHASEEKYKSLIENMNEAIFLANETGEILFLNQQFSKITGYSHDELLGVNGYELLAPKNNRDNLKNKILSRKNGVSETYETQLVKKDGSVLLIRNSASPIIENGKFMGVMSVMTDITHEKKQEKLLQSIHDSLGVATGDGYFSELTNFLFKNLSIKIVMIATYSSNENTAKTISFRLNGKTVDNVKYNLENTPCSNVAGKGICIYPDKVQELFPLDQDLKDLNAHSYIGIPLFDSANRPSGLIVIIDDKPMVELEEKELVLSMIARRASVELERSNIEKSLLASELNYRSVVEDQTEHILRWLPDGKIVFSNTSHLKFHNLSEEEMLKRNFFDLVSKSESDRIRKKITRLTPSFPVSTDTHQSFHPILGSFWHEWTDRAFFDDQGKVTIYQSVGRDITIQKLSEIKLSENESRFRMLVENSFDIYSICDEGGRIIYCSPNVKNILGYEPDKLINALLFDFLHLTDSSDIINKFKELFHSSSKQHVFIHKILSAKKEFRIFQTTAKAILGKTGERTVVFNSNDITEKHVAEKKLKEAAEILDLVDSIVVVVKPDITITYVSPSVKKVLGFEPDELLGKMWWEKTTLGHVFMQKEIDLMAKVFADKFIEENNYYERIVVTKEGQLKWIGWEKSMAPNGSIIGVGHDITKKKKAEHKLEESEKYLSVLLESIPDLLFRIDRDGKILDYKSNDGESLSPTNAGGLKGLNYLRLIPKNIIGLHNQCVGEALGSGKIVSYDFEIKMAPNKSLYYETRMKSNTSNELILIVRDITERKNSDRKIQKHEELLSFSHKLSKIGHYTYNCDTNVLFWSEEFCAIFELDFKTTVPSFDLFFSLIHPEDHDRVKELISSMQKNPRPYKHTYRIITHSGIEKHFRGTSELSENEWGEKILIGVTQDITEIKDFENALLQREKQIQRSFKLNKQIIETSDQFFYISKANPQKIIGQRIAYASPQVEKMFGIPQSEFISDISIWHQAIHPDDFKEALLAAQEMQKTKKPLTLIYRIKNKISDTYCWVEDYVCPQLDGDGEIMELYGSVKDINERKIAEEELLKSESLLKESQRIAKLGTWELDLNSRSISFNDEMFRILEISSNNFDGNLDHLINFISPESVDRFQEAISNAFTDYKSENIELKIVTAKGNEKKLLVRGSEQREISQSRNIAHGTVLDITELWKSHEALFATEEKFKKLFEAITDVYYQADLNGICTIVSPSCFEMFGYNQSDLVGKPIANLYEFPEQRSKMLELLKRDGFINHFETSLRRKNGNPIYVSANISFVLDSHQKPIGIKGIVRDITEKRKNELEREKLLLELTNKYNQLMQFNYIVSHNLRSPITNLLGLSKMFDGPTNAQEKKTIINHIRNSVMAMDGLLVDLNMILAMRTAINENKEEVLLTDIFDTIKNNLHTQIAESSAMLVSDIAEDNNKLFTIKSYLQSILYNLVNNAIKYRANDRKPIIMISCKKKEEHILISVTDNGNGIDLSKFGKQLFGLYKRFDLSKEGRGLGLHMTKTQVEALGGEINVESEFGKGTTFTITLPN